MDGHAQKWVWPVWSWDSKIDFISKLNKWNNLIFCMLVQMQEGWKLIQSFLSVPCQRWQQLFSSWDPKTCIWKMNIWIELIILMLIVMQEFLVRLISYSLTFKCWGSTVVVLLVCFCILTVFSQHTSILQLGVCYRCIQTEYSKYMGVRQCVCVPPS